MQSYFLKQPNGKLAVFSEAVNRFTFSGLTESEAFVYGSARWGQQTAQAMILSAIKDHPLHAGGKSDGLSRWSSALTAIGALRGIDGIRQALSDVGVPDADIPQSALDAALEFAGQH